MAAPPTRILVGAALCMALPAFAADAQGDDTAELESLLAIPVYAASKYQQSLADAPAAVTVITQGEIRAFGWRTLAEVLNAIRGVHMRYDRAYYYTGVRGLGRPGDYSSRLLLLVDGVRLNDNVYDSVLVGRESPLDLELIDRIEFIPGPGSAVHGSNAVLGTINLITRDAAGLRGRQLAASVDTQAGWKLGGSTTSEHASGALLLAGHLELRPGETLAFPEYDSPAAPGGVVRGLDGENAARVFLRFAAENWSVSALAGRRAKEIPNAPFSMVFADPAAEWVDSLGMLDFNWHPAEVDGEGWAGHAGVGRYTYGDHGVYEPDGELIRYENLGLWLQGELNRTLRIGSRQQLLMGMAAQRDIRQDLSTQVQAPVPGPVLRTGTSGTRLGVYASDDITLTARWRLGLGVRLDRDATHDWTMTPRLSLLWRPAPSLALKALAGEAYRSASAYERAPFEFSPQPFALEPLWNDELKREHTSARELVLDWQPTSALRLAASLYQYDVKDMLEQVLDPDTGQLPYANVSSAKARGVEAEAEYHAAWGLRVRSSVSHQNAEYSNGAWLSNSPRWLTKLHATVPLPVPALRAGLELQGVGRRLTETGATLPGYLLTNVSLGWNPPGQKWSTSLTVHNLFDRRVLDPTSLEYLSDRVAQDGREATLRLYVTF